MSLWWQKCVLFFCVLWFTVTLALIVTRWRHRIASLRNSTHEPVQSAAVMMMKMAMGWGYMMYVWGDTHSHVHCLRTPSDVVIFRNAFHAVGLYRSAFTISWPLHVASARHRRDRWINGIAHVWRIVNIKTIITSPLSRSHETRRFAVCHALCFCSLRAWAHISQNPEKRIKIKARSCFLLVSFFCSVWLTNRLSRHRYYARWTSFNLS